MNLVNNNSITFNSYPRISEIKIFKDKYKNCLITLDVLGESKDNLILQTTKMIYDTLSFYLKMIHIEFKVPIMAVSITGTTINNKKVHMEHHRLAGRLEICFGRF